MDDYAKRWRPIASAPRTSPVLAWAPGWPYPLVTWWDVNISKWIGGGYIRDGKNGVPTHAPPMYWNDIPAKPAIVWLERDIALPASAN